ncbi:Hint domain-containing protein [Roseobacteraceae bacterium NS-SX3]
MSGGHDTLQSVPAYPAAAFRVESGANLGDPLGVLEDLVLDDAYRLAPGARPRRLAIAARHDGSFCTGAGSELGTPGAPLHLDCALTLMPQAGLSTEALVLVETDAAGMIADIFLLPAAPLQPHADYTLVRAGRGQMRQVLAQMACAAFLRGTRITMATGEQRPIEDLCPGDRILTRDAGVQELRWTGQTTLRAVGELAPVLIRAGALNNARDLVVSPNHRLMVYQRRDEIGAGCPEILVRARDLVNGHSVQVLDGGFADYVQILFDRHHIIYAEGIAAESLFLDPVTRPALPEDALARLAAPPAHARGAHGVDVSRSLLDRPDAVTVLKRASLR